MTGYAFLIATCICCRRTFTCNPRLVPSTRALTGEREPVCRPCIDVINERRAEQDLEPFEIQPGAYDPIAETEL